MNLETNTWRQCKPTCPTAPHAPRPLSPAEERREDIYVFQSPKNRRNVTVVEPTRLALALELEFDPSVTRYVERPRELTVGDQIVELCFWHETVEGEEQYDLLTSQKEATVHAVRRAERLTALTFEAAVKAGLPLRIRKTSHFLAGRIANTVRLQLLGYVQAAQALQSGLAVEQAVLQHLESTPRTTFYALERTLHAFQASDVRAHVCRMIHQGALSIEWTSRLSLGSALWRNGAVP